MLLLLKQSKGNETFFATEMTVDLVGLMLCACQEGGTLSECRVALFDEVQRFECACVCVCVIFFFFFLVCWKQIKSVLAFAVYHY